MRHKKLFELLLLVILIICIHIYSQNDTRVETTYSTLVYPVIAELLRSISGLASFSIGDIIYLMFFLGMIWYAIGFIKSIIFIKSSKADLIKKSWIAVFLICMFYIVFNFLWGINYNRRGITAQLELTSGKYDTAQLKMINLLLLKKVNATKDSVVNKKIILSDNPILFKTAKEAYESASLTYGFMKYEHPSVKSSIWGWLGNYLGFTGYYNPFTGEAQVNTTIPDFLRPYVACHEIAHQLGYARENEANFVGYLAAKSSDNYLLQYSAYLDLFIYANRALYMFDSTSSMRLRDQLSAPVKKDVKEWRDFIISHENPIEPLITLWYGVFLKNNQQPMGIMTYDEVTGLLIHYYEKTGSL